MPAPAITGYRAHARQEYTCHECGTPILSGTWYERHAIRPNSGLTDEPGAPCWLVQTVHVRCPTAADAVAYERSILETCQ